jgi:hypothetical protein
VLTTLTVLSLLASSTTMTSFTGSVWCATLSSARTIVEDELCDGITTDTVGVVLVT